MLIAIAAAVIAAVVVIALVAVVAVLRARAASPKAGQGKEFKQLDTVGVGSSPFEKKDGREKRACRRRPRREGLLGDQEARRRVVEPLRRHRGSCGRDLRRALGQALVDAGDVGQRVQRRGEPKPLHHGFDARSARVHLRCVGDGVGEQPHEPDGSRRSRRGRRQRRRAQALCRARPSHQRRAPAHQRRLGRAQSQRVVASDVRLRDVAFISEHADAFAGVTVQERTVRDYPHRALCAHALGYTGSPSEDKLKTAIEGREIEATDTVG